MCILQSRTTGCVFPILLIFPGKQQKNNEPSVKKIDAAAATSLQEGHAIASQLLFTFNPSMANIFLW